MAELFLQSAQYNVNMNGGRTVPCGAPVLFLTIPKTQFQNFIFWGTSVRNLIIQKVRERSMPIPFNLSLSMSSSVVLNALEKSENQILMYYPGSSKQVQTQFSISNHPSARHIIIIDLDILNLHLNFVLISFNQRTTHQFFFYHLRKSQVSLSLSS